MLKHMQRAEISVVARYDKDDMSPASHHGQQFRALIAPFSFVLSQARSSLIKVKFKT